MTKQQFMGHCMCDSRFRQLLDKIKTHDIEEVQKLYYFHKSLPRNPKYNVLDKQFNERLGI